MGENHYKGSCNRWIHVKNTDNGKTVTAKIRDLCVSCKNSNRIGELQISHSFPAY